MYPSELYLRSYLTEITSFFCNNFFILIFLWHKKGLQEQTVNLFKLLPLQGTLLVQLITYQPN